MGLTAAVQAQQSPSYAKQVRPFIAKYCLECHNASTTKGDLDLETFKGMMQGGKSGVVVIPGKPDESRLVLQPEGKAKPTMPPKKARQPAAEEVAVLRAWVAAGAKNDSAAVAITLPDIRPRVRKPAPIRALAYRPDGGLLVVGEQKQVLFLDTGSWDVAGKLPEQVGLVTALAFSKDGRWLAVADSTPGKGAVVQLYPVVNGVPAATPAKGLGGHTDAILDLTFSPDGRTLATTGYDRLIRLLDLATDKPTRTLKDHSDAVYGLAFSPDGRLLASAAADRAVKVWDVATGVRLYSLGESTDWVYAVAWSPDGRYLAAAGVDKSIRVWEVAREGGKVVRSVFAHEASITRLTYAADGKTLYSLSEDQTVKAWDTAQMVERKVYPKQPEVALALAVRPDHKQLALGRFDGTLVVLEEATGNVQAEPLPVKPKPPQLTKISPNFGQRGRSIRVTFEGKYLDQTPELTSSYPGVAAGFHIKSKTPSSIHADISFPEDTPAGSYKLGLKTPTGQTAQLPFIVDLFPQVAQVGNNHLLKTAQKLTLNTTVTGVISQAGQVDYYSFEAKDDEWFSVYVLANAIGSKLEPVVQLLDNTGRFLAESQNGVLALDWEGPDAGPPSSETKFILSVRDREYRGGPDRHYRLYLGDLPIVTEVYPLGVQRGAHASVYYKSHNVHIGHMREAVEVHVPLGAAIGSRLPLPITGFALRSEALLGQMSVVVGEFPEVVSAHGTSYWAARLKVPVGKERKPLSGTTDKLVLPVPGTANGRIWKPGLTETWRFPAKKGRRLILEVNARRLGSSLDSYIEILDAKSQPVPRAVLRCVTKTYVTFRDHESTSPGIRLETWGELAMNDYLWGGDELMRIHELPKNPDDDCQFFSVHGQRRGYLDTTPTYLSLGTSLYKVTIHPPGTTFPPNGFPVIHLNYRNDDGGPGYGKDSRLFFDPPADGDYQIRIGDSQGKGGSNFGYRLTVRPPRPDFSVSFNPSTPAVWQGGAVPVTVSAERTDGFEGPISVHLENLPAGFSAPATSIPAEESSTAFALWADATAKTPSGGQPLKLVARALINGKEVVREVTGSLPRVMEPGELATTTEQSEVTVKPGQQVWLKAKIDRRKGFTGRVPLDVRGLPHGVRVLDIGLNGILITEKESSRAFAIYAEPWVQPTTHPFVVLARNEGKGTEFAARSVLLRVAAP
jgi:WD40 repeat protein